VDSSRTRNLITIFIVLAAMGVLVYQQFQASNARTEVIQINQLAADLRAGKVKEIVVNENDLDITYTDGKEAKSRKEPDSSLSIQLEAYGVTSADLEPGKVNIEVRQPSDWGLILNLATYLIPVLLFGGLIYFMLRQAQGTNNQAISFGKSRARMFTGDQPTVTFDDVAGVEEAKEELREVIEFLNLYLEAMVDVISRYEGTIDEIIGDAILVIFGAPLACDDHAAKAVEYRFEFPGLDRPDQSPESWVFPLFPADGKLVPFLRHRDEREPECFCRTVHAHAGISLPALHRKGNCDVSRYLPLIPWQR